MRHLFLLTNIIYTLALLEFNMFGIPMVGADICGFAGNTTKQLCQRWSALGAFYPFSRNHNDIAAFDQDPAALGPEVVAAAKYALELRYRVIPYMYTMLYRASMFGETVMRPLFFEWPKDKEAQKIEEQFLLGGQLMVVPGLYENVTKVHAYFPSAKWYNDSGLLVTSTGQYLDLDIPMDKILLARRGGSVIPEHPTAQTTTQQREHNYTISVYLDEQNQACGSLFIDDGESIGTLLTVNYTLVDFVVKDNQLSFTNLIGEFKANTFVDTVRVYGLDSPPNDVKVNGQSIDKSNFNFDANKVLTINNLSIDLLRALTTLVWQ